MQELQNLKDTFYLMLRDRVAAGNAARTVVVRGAVRPAVVVVENELPGASVEGIALAETFCLRWTGLRVDARGASPLTAAMCEIRYATDGTSGNGGMDRGRALAAMDWELSAALNAGPQNVGLQTVAKMIVAEGAGATSTTDGTNVFWGDVIFGAAVMRAERMERTATVEVYCYGN